MTAQQIHCFLTLSKEQSFSRTAEALYVSQPVISRYISTLENELGFKLFWRDRQTVELTPSGRLMLDFFQRTAAEYGNAFERAKALAKGSVDTISIGLLELYDNAPILSAIGQFSDATFYVERHERPCMPHEVLSGHFDIGTTFENLVESEPRLSFIPLLKSQDHLLLSKKHVLASKNDLKPEDIDVLHMVSDDGTKPANFLPERKTACHLEKARTTTLPNLSSVLALVESGRACTVLQQFALSHIRFPFVAIPLNYYHSVGLTYRKDDRRTSVKSFLSLIRQLYPDRQTSS